MALGCGLTIINLLAKLVIDLIYIMIDPHIDFEFREH
ncbi:hypothetical protein DSUL_20216 [Desulfovibrionales bacterium]